MQTVLDGGAAAIQVLVMMIAGWISVYLVTRILEPRIRGAGRGRRRGGVGTLGAVGWLWDYSNVIGIPTLLFGTAYLVWSMYWGPGLSSGPTLLIILLMSAAGLLIGFGPGLRR